MPTLPRDFTQHFWDLSQNLQANSAPKQSPIDAFFAYQRQHPQVLKLPSNNHPSPQELS